MSKAGMATMTFKNYGVVTREPLWVEQQRPYVPSIEVTIPTIDDALIIDTKELKHTIDKLIYDFFENPNVFNGVFWSAFVTYIFPVLTDIAKVWCAVQVISAFFKERQGRTDAGGKTGWQSFATYGKWYLIFIAIPWFVELVDEIGHKMYGDLMKKGVDGATTNGAIIDIAHELLKVVI